MPNFRKRSVVASVALATLAVSTPILPAAAEGPVYTGSSTVEIPCVGADQGSQDFLAVVAAQTGGVLPVPLSFQYDVPAQLAFGASAPVAIEGSVSLTQAIIDQAAGYGIIGTVVSDINLVGTTSGPGSVSPPLTVVDPGPYSVDFTNPVFPTFAATGTVTAGNSNGRLRYQVASLTVSLGLDDGTSLFPLNLTCSGPVTLASTRVGQVAAVDSDFNGDGFADRGVYRNGGWLVVGQPAAYLGLASDKPVPADYNGDGTIDKAIYRNGAWFTQSQPTAYFGNATDKPVPADYNGDGTADRAVYRNGAWLTQSQPTVYFGNATDKPVPADYNGDGTADRMIYRNGGWLSPTLPAAYFGLGTDNPVPADYNGDGSADRAIYRGGAWLTQSQPTVYFGNATDIPVPADYNADGAADRMVYRAGGWLAPNLSPVYFGNGTDRPLQIRPALG